MIFQRLLVLIFHMRITVSATHGQNLFIKLVLKISLTRTLELMFTRLSLEWLIQLHRDKPLMLQLTNGSHSSQVQELRESKIIHLMKNYKRKLQRSKTQRVRPLTKSYLISRRLLSIRMPQKKLSHKLVMMPSLQMLLVQPDQKRSLALTQNSTITMLTPTGQHQEPPGSPKTIKSLPKLQVHHLSTQTRSSTWTHHPILSTPTHTGQHQELLSLPKPRIELTDQCA